MVLVLFVFFFFFPECWKLQAVKADICLCEKPELLILNDLYTLIRLPCISQVFCFEITIVPHKKRGAMKLLNSQYCLKDLDQNLWFWGREGCMLLEQLNIYHCIS